MARYIDADKQVGIGYLSDWYQSSIDDTKPPIWTDEHLEELTNDFIVIPKDTPTADVVEVVRCGDCRHSFYISAKDELECRKHNGCLKYPHDFCSYGERKET